MTCARRVTQRKRITGTRESRARTVANGAALAFLAKTMARAGYTDM